MSSRAFPSVRLWPFHGDVEVRSRAFSSGPLYAKSDEMSCAEAQPEFRLWPFYSGPQHAKSGKMPVPCKSLGPCMQSVVFGRVWCDVGSVNMGAVCRSLKVACATSGVPGLGK